MNSCLQIMQKNLVDYMQSLEKVEKKPDIFFNQLEDIVNVISIIYFFQHIAKKPNFINNKVYLITVVVGFAFKMIQPSFFLSGEILLSLCSLTVVPYFFIIIMNYQRINNNGKYYCRVIDKLQKAIIIIE